MPEQVQIPGAVARAQPAYLGPPENFKFVAAPKVLHSELQVKERLQAAFARFPTMASVPPNSTVWLTFTNGTLHSAQNVL